MFKNVLWGAWPLPKVKAQAMPVEANVISAKHTAKEVVGMRSKFMTDFGLEVRSAVLCTGSGVSGSCTDKCILQSRNFLS